MTVPRFTVVIPAHNAARTLATTLDSVLAQSCQDFEIQIVDDGSTDRTLAIALTYAAQDDRVVVTAQSPQGVSAARNLAVSKAKGDFLAFLDADDCWTSDKLAEHAAFHDANPHIDASFAQIAFCAEVNGAMQRGRTRSSVPGHMLGIEDVVIENAVCTCSNLVIDRAVFLALGGFRREIRHCEDQDFLARYIEDGWIIAGIDRHLVDYRLSADGLSCDFDAMLSAWRALAERWDHRIDVKRGEALYLRYLTRRALRAGDRGLLSRRFMRAGLAADRDAFLRGRRGALTVGGALAAAALPQPLRAALFA